LLVGSDVISVGQLGRRDNEIPASSCNCTPLRSDSYRSDRRNIHAVILAVKRLGFAGLIPIAAINDKVKS